jgi:2-(1,2-epoxy-1,2-dihydrophenyl)acetyl-CoA isomerase
VALVAEGDKLAAQLAGAASGALGATRALLRQSLESSFETQLEREVVAITSAGVSPECREGLSAYFAKRPPDFKGV